MAFKEAQQWIDARYAAGAKRIGVTCNPIQRKLFLVADNETEIIDCPTRKETSVLRQMLHEYIGRLPIKP